MTESNKVHALTQSEFENTINQHPIVIIDFWAQWCAPCRQFANVYEKVAADTEGVHFAKVNIEEQSELAETFQIRSIPHIMVFKEGIVIYSEAGSLPESALKELVDQAKEADVSDIKAKLEQDEKA